jgi:hypothetical protein
MLFHINKETAGTLQSHALVSCGFQAYDIARRHSCGRTAEPPPHAAAAAPYMGASSPPPPETSRAAWPTARCLRAFKKPCSAVSSPCSRSLAQHNWVRASCTGAAAHAQEPTADQGRGGDSGLRSTTHPTAPGGGPGATKRGMRQIPGPPLHAHMSHYR